MITGFDHILFLLGVIFFLYKMEHIGIYVSLFAIAHSTTMLLGVYFDWAISSYFIDAIIGLSVVYKALDNIGAFQRWLGFQPNIKAATLIFGLFRGLGLATKVLEYDMCEDGLLPNLIAFNVGVEIGQLLALATILIAMGFWRRTLSFWKLAYSANVAMLCPASCCSGISSSGSWSCPKDNQTCTIRIFPPRPTCPPTVASSARRHRLRRRTHHSRHRCPAFRIRHRSDRLRSTDRTHDHGPDQDAAGRRGSR